MKKIIISLVVVAILFMPAEAKKTKSSLETRVEQLEMEVSNLESYVNFMLSDEYVDYLVERLESSQ